MDQSILHFFQSFFQKIGVLPFSSVMHSNTRLMNVSSKFMLLRDLDIFKGLDDKEIELLAKKTEMQKLKKGKPIYKADVKIDHVTVTS